MLEAHGEFGTLHGSEELKTKMHQIQSCESAKRINQQFASWEIDQHDGNTNETVLCIKVKSALLGVVFRSPLLSLMHFLSAILK